jgi:hypothetical protein
MKISEDLPYRILSASAKWVMGYIEYPLMTLYKPSFTVNEYGLKSEFLNRF